MWLGREPSSGPGARRASDVTPRLRDALHGPISQMRTPRLPRVKGGRLVRKEGGTGTRTWTVASGRCRLGRRPSRAPAGAPTRWAAASHQPGRAQTSGHVPPSPRRPQLKAPCELGTPFQLSRVYPLPAARALGKPGPVALISNQTRAPSQAPPWWEPGRGRRRAACTWPPPRRSPESQTTSGPMRKSRPGPPRPSALPAGPGPTPGPTPHPLPRWTAAKRRCPTGHPPPRAFSWAAAPPADTAAGPLSDPPARSWAGPLSDPPAAPGPRGPALGHLIGQNRTPAQRAIGLPEGAPGPGPSPREPGGVPAHPPSRLPTQSPETSLTKHMTSRSLASVPDTT